MAENKNEVAETKATAISTNWYIGKININLITQQRNLLEIKFSIETN